jgi:DNA-binding CsgD family transcriptional regulator
MSFEQDMMHGYENNSEHFDKWCDKSSSILGNVTQCGILECDSTGNAFLATNRPDVGETYLANRGYLLDSYFSFDEKLKSIILLSSTRSEYEPSHPSGLFRMFEKHGNNYGVSYVEKINEQTQRLYFFSSNSPEIHNYAINNIQSFKKMLSVFKQDANEIIDYFQDRKFNIADHKTNYFRSEDRKYLTERERLNDVMHKIGLLNQDLSISEREYECLHLYCLGYSANESSKILGISRRTIESHFNSLKNKLNVKSKSELIETIN